MTALIKKEITSFFSSTMGYLVIAVFLVINGLFLWVFSSDYNVFDAGFADLSAFFELAPWVLLFLIPAITMRAFSDEKRMGTLELLYTLPISTIRIVLGKYLGAFLLSIIALTPTLLYILTIDNLVSATGIWDLGSTIGSYIGLLFLTASFTAIGVFTSTFSKNQIVAFLFGICISFFLYFGFQGVSGTSSAINIEQLGMQHHYQSLSRGVIELRSVAYFIILIVLFVVLTSERLKPQGQKRTLKSWGVPLLLGVILIFIGLTSTLGLRFDLTQDQRYTLSEEAKHTITDLNSPMSIDVFLDGNLPPEFKRLQLETQQLLREFSSYNSNLVYKFIDPTSEEVDAVAIQKQMAQMGLRGANVEIRDQGKVSNEVVYPYALAYFNDKTVAIPLLKNQLGTNQEERVNNSIQNLEYAFADGFGKLVQPKRRKIAVLRGNGEMEDRYLADFISTLKDYYFIGQFTLDSVAKSPQKTLAALNEFDLAIIAQPTQLFTEEEKYVLDQYTMDGGSSLWLIDATQQHLDTVSGKTFAFPRDVGLGDFFFRYGLRINPDLVKDIYAAPIALASGDGRDAQYDKYPWLYSPLAAGTNNHPIVTNLEVVKFDYASSIDLLNNDIQKTVLLSTSPMTKIVGLPSEISIDKEIPKNLKIINEGPNPEEFNAGATPLAVLLEGEFTSAYANRIKPFKATDAKDNGSAAKMIVISDGDLIKNQLDRGRPLELGFDKWTNSFYGNKEFLLNSVNYLLDDSGLINIRTKEISVAFLDPEKTADKRGFWQLLNIVLPLGLLGLFGVLFFYFRRKKYASQEV